jgi:large subunit ribosomal protein L31
MKAGIHPLYVVSTVQCACGNKFETRSTKELIKLEICSNCHPFYTGQQRLVDTAGRVERFKKRFEATQGKTIERKAQTKVKKIEHVGAAAKRQKGTTLSTAPKADKDAKGAKKPAAPAKKA